MLTFLSPLFLIGILSAAIPLIIHLSRSRRTKKMRFSTTRFFTDQFLRSYRMSRLKELLLLACRMALCALLAMALARPLLLPRGESYLMSGSRSVVLVLDNSASMAYTEDGRTLFDRARSAARELIEGLRPGDTAAIVLAGRREAGPEVLFPQPTPELGDVLQAVDGLQAATLGTDLTAALARAETLVLTSTAQSKEIYVLSDLQDSGWEIRPSETEPPGVADVLYFFVSVRPRQPVSNLGITAVQYAASRPMVGVPFGIRPHLEIEGSHRSAEVRLYIDGKKVSERQLEKLPTGRWAVPRFYHTFTTGGWHSGYIEVQDSTLPLDNRRYFAFEVLDSFKLLAVNGAPSQIPQHDELFFLQTALTANPEGKSPIDMDVVSPAGLADKDLSAYPLAILANVAALSPAGLEKLEAFVDRGGSLLVFLGDKVDSTFYNQSLSGPARLHGGLLPGRLAKNQATQASGDNLSFIANVDYEHVALAAFADPQFAKLSGVTFKSWWEVDPGESAVLMRANSGAPLLCEKSFGQGRVLLFASTCDRDWTSFPVRPAFLPWIHRVVGYLAQRSLGRQPFHHTGDSVPLPTAVSEGSPQVLVTKPDGTTAPATVTEDSTNPLVFTDTILPGIYKIQETGKKANPTLLAINLEKYESNLTYLDDVLENRPEAQDLATRDAKIEAGFKELWPGRPLVSFIADPARVTEVSQAARRGIKLWDIVLLIVLAIALFEPWLANRISMRHYSRPKELTQAVRSQ